MRIVPIKDIQQLGDGETVPSVKGRLVVVYDRKTGTNAKGDWSLQNAELQDDTGKIKVQFSGREAMPPNLKNQWVCIQCNDGGKGLTGIKASDDTYRNQTTRILRVTPSAHIELVDGQPTAAAPAPTPRQEAPQPSPATNTQPTPAPTPSAPPENGNGHASEQANRVSIAALARARDYYRVMAEVYQVRVAWDAKHPDAPMTADHFQAAVSTVYIQLERDGVINGNH